MRSKFSNYNKNNNYDTQNFNHRFFLPDCRVRTLQGNIHMPVTNRQWTTTTDDMYIIDATKNADNPKRKDLEALKYICKND